MAARHAGRTSTRWARRSSPCSPCSWSTRVCVELDTPIASFWPEFAPVAARRGATVRHALCHRAGVPAIRERLTDDDLWDWERMTGALAATEAWWEPGTRHAYHTNTYGHLIGEVVRRVSGRAAGRAAAPCRRTARRRLWFGVPAAEQHRCAEVIWAPTGRSADRIDREPGRAAHRPQLCVVRRRADERARARQSAGLLVDRRGQHGVLAVGADPVHERARHGHRARQPVRRAARARTRCSRPTCSSTPPTVQSTGPCPILGEDDVFGLGFMPTNPGRPLGPNPRSFGHFGTGGALGFADPDTGIAFGYVMNHVIPRWRSARNQALVDGRVRRAVAGSWAPEDRVSGRRSTCSSLSGRPRRPRRAGARERLTREGRARQTPPPAPTPSGNP